MDSHPVCESKWICDTTLYDIHFLDNRNIDYVLSYVLKQNLKWIYNTTTLQYICHIVFNNIDDQVINTEYASNLIILRGLDTL